MKLLYGIAFLGLAKSKFGDPVFACQEEERAQYAGNVRDGTFFVIHQAFHQALDLDNEGEEYRGSVGHLSP